MAQLRNVAGISSTDWRTFAPKLFARLQIDELQKSSAAPDEVAAALVRRLWNGHALHGAVSAGKKLANQDADQDFADLMRKHLTRLLDLHQQITKSLYFEAATLLELLLLTDLKMKAHEGILNEVAGCDGRAPLFDIPVLHERLYSRAITAARETGRDDLLEIYDRAHDKAFRQSLPEEQAPTGIAQVVTRIQKDFDNTLDLERR